MFVNQVKTPARDQSRNDTPKAAIEVEDRGNKKDTEDGRLNDENLHCGTQEGEQTVVRSDDGQYCWIERTISVQANISNGQRDQKSKCECYEVTNETAPSNRGRPE